MEVKAWIFDFDQLADRLFVSVHVEQHKELRVVFGYTKVVINMAVVLIHVVFDGVFDFFEGSYDKLMSTVEEFSIRSDILDKYVHWFNAFFDDFF